jgi:hypothetical protein
MVVDEGDHVRDRRSSSAIADDAEALRGTPLACRSAWLSRARALIRSRSFAVGPTHPVAQRLA